METKNKGKIFSVRFVKKDGTTRFMKCRTGVTAKLKGGELPYDPTSKGLKPVFDLACNNYRMVNVNTCLLYTSPSPRDRQKSRMPSSA